MAKRDVVVSVEIKGLYLETLKNKLMVAAIELGENCTALKETTAKLGQMSATGDWDGWPRHCIHSPEDGNCWVAECPVPGLCPYHDPVIQRLEFGSRRGVLRREIIRVGRLIAKELEK